MLVLNVAHVKRFNLSVEHGHAFTIYVSPESLFSPESEHTSNESQRGNQLGVKEMYSFGVHFD